MRSTLQTILRRLVLALTCVALAASSLVGLSPAPAEAREVTSKIVEYRTLSVLYVGRGYCDLWQTRTRWVTYELTTGERMRFGVTGDWKTISKSGRGCGTRKPANVR